MKKYMLFVFGVAALGFMGCEKNTFRNSNYINTDDKAMVKVNFFSPYQVNKPYHIRINGERVSNVITRYDTPFPGGGLNTGGASTTDYTMVEPGSAVFSFAVPKSGTSVDSVDLGSATHTLEAGTKYSVYFTDTAQNLKSLLVIDSLTRPDSGYARYKFINLIPDLPSADLYVGTVKVASAVPFLGVSPSFVLPTNNASSSWSIRDAGGTSALATYAGTLSATIGNQRVYTVVARGFRSISATSDNRRRNLSLIYNL